MFAITRTFPSNSKIFPATIDWLMIWKSTTTNGKWHDGYVGDKPLYNGDCFKHLRNIFDSYDYAESVAIIMSERWKGAEFRVEYVGKPIIHPKE